MTPDTARVRAGLDLPAALSVYQPLDNAHTRLICFAHAGGAASAFRSLKQALAPSGVEVCALQAGGRENRMNDPYASSAELLAEEFAAAIACLAPMPTAYLGHSMGGLIAFLTTRLIAPDRLIVSASMSPASLVFPRTTHALPGPAFRERLFAMGGVPQSIRDHSELFDMFEPAIRADYRILDNYLHRDHGRIGSPVTVYVAEQDTAVAVQSARQWQNVAQSPVSIRRFAGGHFYLYQDTQLVAAALLEDLGLAEEKPPASSNHRRV